MILISNDFWHKRKTYNFDPYNVLLSIATNIAVLFMTACVLQGHMFNNWNKGVELVIYGVRAPPAAEYLNFHLFA